jgi:serine/threonine-protein kinase
MDYADAVDALNQANLQAKRKNVFSKRPSGQVVAQNPPAQEVVDEGTVVTLNVSKGVKTVVVPNVLDQTEASARSELEAAEFEVQVVNAPSDSTPEGFVSAQSPDPGTEATKGSTVTITVSTGPETTTVPNVVGEEKEAAKADLQAAGFHVKVENVPVADPTADNVVQDQDPAGGSDAPNGSTVTIFVGQF